MATGASCHCALALLGSLLPSRGIIPWDQPRAWAFPSPFPEVLRVTGQERERDLLCASSRSPPALP